MANPLFDRLIAPHADKDKPFLILQGGARITYAEFAARTAQFAHALTEAGLVPGDRVAIQAEKSPDTLALIFAAARAGLVFLPLNTGYTASEIAYFIENSGAKLFICDPAKAADMAPVAKEAGAGCETLSPEGTGSLQAKAAKMASDFATIDRDTDALAAFLYTSGTTGRSKGAMLTHGNLLSNAETLVELWQFTEDDVLLHALPIFHTHGLFVATTVILLAGGSMIFLPKFDLEEVLAGLSKATSMMGVPTFYTRLLDSPAFTRELGQHMRLFISGSAPLLAETHRAFEARTGLRILERYGMTETNMNTSNPYDGERRPGTVGFPLPGVDLKICDPETGATLPQGEIGVIEVRGPNVFKGYWQMPEKTAAELRDDGFFITGDLGLIDADGYVHIVGRGKDLIISGGYNVYPKEIEILLDDQPGVLERAVVGVAHPDFGEGVVAVLVAEPGQTPDLDAIKDHLKKTLAAYKRPKRIEVIESLPRNTMGKVQKNILRDSYADSFRA